MNNFDKVKTIIVNELDVPESQINLDTNVTKDLGADSLTLIEMIMSFEQEFDVEIPEEALDNLETVGDIVAALNDLGIK